MCSSVPHGLRSSTAAGDFSQKRLYCFHAAAWVEVFIVVKHDGLVGKAGSEEGGPGGREAAGVTGGGAAGAAIGTLAAA